MYVDSHCHLDDKSFQSDLDQIIQRAFDNRVETILTIGTKLEEIPHLQTIAKSHPRIYYSTGIHPDGVYAVQNLSILKETLCAFATDSKMVGYGETGLDYYRDTTFKQQQKQSFRAHLQAAQTTQIPVIIHCRGDGAEEDILNIIDEEGYGSNHILGVIHCFTGSKKFASEALDRGFYISLSGIISFKNAIDLQDIAKHLPLDRVLIETDSPYLAPVPFRGKRNEPSFVIHTAEKLAALKDLPLKVIAETTTNNFYKVFSKCQRP